MEASKQAALRKELIASMKGNQAHIDFESALSDFPEEMRGAKSPGAPHSAWQLLEHMRIAQWDILEYSRHPDHKSPKWPDEYWPKEEAPPNAAAWDDSVRSFKRDFAAMEKLLDREDLFAKVAAGGEKTLLREAMLIANHNSYHLGQLVFLRKTLAG